MIFYSVMVMIMNKLKLFSQRLCKDYDFTEMIFYSTKNDHYDLPEMTFIT